MSPQEHVHLSSLRTKAPKYKHPYASTGSEPHPSTLEFLVLKKLLVNHVLPMVLLGPPSCMIDPLREPKIDTMNMPAKVYYLLSNLVQACDLVVQPI